MPHLGPAAQERLAHARVVSIGAGGVKSSMLYYLAAAGVGHLTIIDFDRVELSNLSRQILYTEEDNRISAILDWELGHLGDRHEDLAWTIRSSFGHLAEDGKTFLVGGFMPETQFLDLYRERSGFTVDAKKLDFYRIFNAYKNALIVLATGRRVASGGKGHQDVLLGWLTGVGYTMLEDMWAMLNELL